MATNKLAIASKAAREMLEDPLYHMDLKRRLLAGELAANIEAMLWHYAYGKPVDVIEVKDDRDLAKMSDAELVAYEASLRVLAESPRVN